MAVTGPLASLKRDGLGRHHPFSSDHALTTTPWLVVCRKGSAADGDPIQFIIRRIVPCDDAEILSFARAVHGRFERIPNMGIDIVRHAQSGQLFVLEVNSSGRTWHLSSEFGLGQQRRNLHDYYRQFNALDTLVAGFIETTRRLAA